MGASAAPRRLLAGALRRVESPRSIDDLGGVDLRPRAEMARGRCITGSFPSENMKLLHKWAFISAKQSYGDKFAFCEARAGKLGGADSGMAGSSARGILTAGLIVLIALFAAI